MKLAHWFSRLWNLMDALFVVTYLMAQPLRYDAGTFRWGRSLICCNNMYWWVLYQSSLLRLAPWCISVSVCLSTAAL